MLADQISGNTGSCDMAKYLALIKQSNKKIISIIVLASQEILVAIATKQKMYPSACVHRHTDDQSENILLRHLRVIIQGQ